MTDKPDPDLFRQAVDDITGPIVQLRRIILAALVTAIVAIVTVGFGIYAIVHVNQVSHQARVAQCESTNASRHAVFNGWNRFFSIFAPDPTRLPAHIQQQLTSLDQYFAVIYAPSDCTHIP